MGLSSIASLSLGLSMSMTGAGAGTIMMRSLAMRPTIHHHGRGGGAFHGSGHPITHRAFPDNPGTSGQPSTAGGLHQQGPTSTSLHPTSRQSEDSSCCLVQLDEEEDDEEDRSLMDILTVHSDPKTDSRSPSPDDESLPSIEQTLSSAISLITSYTNGQTPGQESVGFRFDSRKSPSTDAIGGPTFSRRKWTSEEHLTSHHRPTTDRSFRRVGSQLPPGLTNLVDRAFAPDLPAKRLGDQRSRHQPNFGFTSTGQFSSNDHAIIDMRQRNYLVENRDAVRPPRTDSQFQVTSPLNSNAKRCNIPASTYGATTDEVQRIHRIRSVEYAGTYDDSSAMNRNAIRPQSFRDRSSGAGISTRDGRNVPPVGSEPDVTDFGTCSKIKSAPEDRSCVTISGTVVAESVSMDRHACPVDQQICRKKVDGLGALENGSAPALILGVQRKATANTTGELKHDDKVAISSVRSLFISFTQSFTQSFTHSLAYLLNHSLIYLFIHSSTESLTSCTHFGLTYSFAYSLAHSSLTRSFVRSFIHSAYSFANTNELYILPKLCQLAYCKYIRLTRSRRAI